MTKIAVNIYSIFCHLMRHYANFTYSYSFFIDEFEQMSHNILVTLLLTLKEFLLWELTISKTFECRTRMVENRVECIALTLCNPMSFFI